MNTNKRSSTEQTVLNVLSVQVEATVAEIATTGKLGRSPVLLSHKHVHCEMCWTECRGSLGEIAANTALLASRLIVGLMTTRHHENHGGPNIARRPLRACDFAATFTRSTPQPSGKSSICSVILLGPTKCRLCVDLTAS